MDMNELKAKKDVDGLITALGNESDDVREGTGEARDIVHRAISPLVDTGGYRMRWIEDVGVVVEEVR